MSTVTAIKYGEDEQEQEEVAPYELDFSLTHKVNLGQQQNEIPFLQHLQFRNNTQEDIKDLCISITSDPAFLQAVARGKREIRRDLHGKEERCEPHP